MPYVKKTAAETLPVELRLDRYIAENLGLLSRSQIKARKLHAKINGKDVKISRPVKTGDIIELSWEDSVTEDLIPENLPLDILYEDERLAVINKEQGMVVHPGAGNRQGTLANALYFRRLRKGICAESPRPGIVHRLDKDTSGVIIAAYNDAALAFLSEQFKLRKVKKTYIAIVNGVPKEKKGRIETFISRDRNNRKRFAVSEKGKYALTLYSVKKTWQTHSLVLLRPKTGRTHQLRVHLRSIGCPVAGDPLYGRGDLLFPKASLMLHSKQLEISLPGETGTRVFKAPLPSRFIGMIRFLDQIVR